MNMTETEQTTRLREMLRRALDEMSPDCMYCANRQKNGQCANECKWRFENAARELLKGE